MSRHAAETLAAVLVTTVTVVVVSWLFAQAIIDWGTLP